MNNTERAIQAGGEIPIYETVKYLTKDEVEQTVRRNAQAMQFDLNDDHMNVINSLIEHYKKDCKTRDCLAAHEHMQFLEEAYEFRGGSRYLYMLFDAVPGTRGVLQPIHALAGLPPLQLEKDVGFGTAF